MFTFDDAFSQGKEAPANDFKGNREEGIKILPGFI